MLRSLAGASAIFKCCFYARWSTLWKNTSSSHHKKPPFSPFLPPSQKWECQLRMFVSPPEVLFSTYLRPQIHPRTITPLFMIHFEIKIHLFWQMLVLGQRPKLSLIFFGIVTQDWHLFCFFLLLCCQTNKIAHLARDGIIIFPQGDTMLNLFLDFGGKRFRTLNRLSNDKCARSWFVRAARTLLLWLTQLSRGAAGLLLNAAIAKINKNHYNNQQTCFLDGWIIV